MGLLFDGQAHNLYYLSPSTGSTPRLEAAVRWRSTPVDGRDVHVLAHVYVKASQGELDLLGRPGSIASISGCFYAMGLLPQRWERTDAAFTRWLGGQAAYHEPTALAGLDAAYARDENDEFVVLIACVRGVEAWKAQSVRDTRLGHQPAG